MLNSDGQPLSLMPISTMNWREAVKAIWLDSVAVLHYYDDWFVRSPSVTIQVPSVVITRDWVKMTRHVKYSRNNVYLRDNYTCQYCGEHFHADNLTLEHVKPRKLGGTSTWENTVAACGPCNSVKSHFEIMKPMSKPFKPDYWQLINNLKKRPLVVSDPVWNNYLGWDPKMVAVHHNRQSNKS